MIVVSFVLSAFAGLYVIASPPQSAAQVPIGDLIVEGGTYTIENIEQAVDGDVEVRSGGELIIRNGALKVISNVGTPRTVTVMAGGTLTMEHGVLTSYLDQIDPWPFLILDVDGGTVVASEASAFRFPGYINVENGGEMILYGSSIEALSSADLTQYISGSAFLTMDSADDGPVISVNDASLMLFDSHIYDLPEYPSDGIVASNLTLTGSSTLLAVSSYISVDFGPALTASDWYVHNVLVLEDTSTAHLYGSYFEQYTGTYSARAAAISANGESYIALPTAIGPEDTTGQSVTDLQASNEGAVYHIEPGEVMAIDTFSAGPAATVDAATLHIRYAVAPTYNGANAFTWRREAGPVFSTGITPTSSETSYVERTFDLHAAGVTTTTDLAALDVNFVHGGSSGDVLVDSMSIVITIGPEAYVYRWLNVTVGDEYGVPIPDCEIVSVFTGSTTFGGQSSFYFGTDGASTSPLPPEIVMAYMGVTEDTFGITDGSGVASIPLLTDLVSGGEYPNSLFIGNFELTGSAQGESSTEIFSFPAYPAMMPSDQHFDVTVAIEGISAESPDTARWLVVPPDLTIEDTTYYHAGDVIVASDGTLTLINTVFQLVQKYPYERTIYVDGTALFMIEDSQVISSLAINIVVKGSGTLHVLNSQLSGVNIVAMEDATVRLDGAIVSGSITTSYNARAHVLILDSALAQAPVLSGTTLCEVTNTSAPAITVTDGAAALIYRWIHVTVFDGSGSPLEGADVYARFFVNNTLWASGTTDSSGVARLNSLATILTAVGSTYVGNYKVNASFWSDGEEYTSETVSLGVLPYDQPLTENATFAVLSISSLFLPDISISASSISTTPSSVVLDTECMINVRLTNIGSDSASDVVVDVYVGDSELTAELIGSDTVDLVVKNGGVAVASVPWTPEETGLHTIWVYVNDGPDFDEGSFANNDASIDIMVLDYADLVLGELTFYLFGSVTSVSSIPGGQMMTAKASLTNIGEAPVTDPEVRLTVTYGSTMDIVTKTVTGVLSSGNTFLVSVDYALPLVTENTVFSFQLSANPGGDVLELSYANNNASANLLVLDIREDFKVSVEDVYIQYGIGNGTDPVYGKTVTIVAWIYNLGGTNPGNITIEFGTTLYPSVPIANVSENIPAGASREVRVNYLINLTTGGTYTLYVFADSERKHSEKNESNNRAEIDIEIDQLSVSMSLSLSTEYSAGETIYVVVDVIYSGTTEAVPSLRGVSVELRDSDNVVVVASEGVYTTSAGKASFSLNIPSEIESGTYTLVATVAGLSDTSSASLEIHGTVSGMDIPWLVWIIVIVAIVAVVAGFTLYTYKYGLGKLVECGECGEFIPAASKRCPKCGVEFEVGTMKCSECGAWVPAESTECPNCGVKFVGEELAEEDHLEKMRKEYDEMVSKYRELAKAQLGKKFSDKTFEQWWIAQPIYISFEDWLAKEEEKRNEGPIACPVCGTLNPKEATVCNKCGTVFGAVRKTPPQQQQPPAMPPSAGPEQAQPAAVYQQPPADQAGQPPQAAAPKMVIRRPIDRKVVPKKVIRTPISGEGENTDSGENQ